MFILGARRLRRGVGAVRGRAVDRGARRRPRAAGRVRRAAHAGVAGDHRRRVPRGRARQGDRHVDGLRRHRRGRRAARRRLARRRASTGAGSSRSTCRSCSSRSRSPRGMPARAAATARRAGRTGSAPALCALGLAGPTFGLIQQPEHGWSDPLVRRARSSPASRCSPRSCCGSAGARDPMLPLGLFGRGNFAWGNVETFAMYGGLGRDVLRARRCSSSRSAASRALEAGAGDAADDDRDVPARRGASARWPTGIGPRLFMGDRPARRGRAASLLLLVLGRRATRRSSTEVLPGVVVFALGLSMTVAPLTAAILADADEHNAGIASGVNNAVARVAGLLATAAVGAVVGGALDLDGFRMALGVRGGPARARRARRAALHPQPAAPRRARRGLPRRAARSGAAGRGAAG